MVILHDFIRKNYHKISQIVTIFPHNGKLPDFSYTLPHFKFSDVLSIFIFPPKVPEHCIEKKFNSAIFGIEVLIETNVSEF